MHKPAEHTEPGLVEISFALEQEKPTAHTPYDDEKPPVHTPQEDKTKPVKTPEITTVNVDSGSLKWFALILVLFLALALVGILFVYIALKDESAADKPDQVYIMPPEPTYPISPGVLPVDGHPKPEEPVIV